MINKLVPSFLSLMYIFFVEVAASDNPYTLFDEAKQNAKISTNPLQQNPPLLSEKEKSYLTSYAKSGEDEKAALNLMGDHGAKGEHARLFHENIKNILIQRRNEENLVIVKRLAVVSTVVTVFSTVWNSLEFSQDEDKIGFVDPFIVNVVSVAAPAISAIITAIAVCYK